MSRTASQLLFKCQRMVVLFAQPCPVIFSGCVGASATVHFFCDFALVAKVMPCTHFALVPRRVCADWGWQPVIKRQAFASTYILLRHNLIKSHPFCIDFVVIFADGHIKSPVNAQALHIDLHLHKVLRLRLCHAVLL